MAIAGLLIFPLHVDNSFPVEVTSPYYGRLSPLTFPSNSVVPLSLSKGGLNGENSLPEDKEYNPRSDWSVERGGLEPRIGSKRLRIDQIATWMNPKDGLQGGCHPTMWHWVVEQSKKINR